MVQRHHQEELRGETGHYLCFSCFLAKPTTDSTIRVAKETGGSITQKRWRWRKRWRNEGKDEEKKKKRWRRIGRKRGKLAGIRPAGWEVHLPGGWTQEVLKMGAMSSTLGALFLNFSFFLPLPGSWEGKTQKRQVAKNKWRQLSPHSHSPSSKNGVVVKKWRNDFGRWASHVFCWEEEQQSKVACLEEGENEGSNQQGGEGETEGGSFIHHPEEPLPAILALKLAGDIANAMTYMQEIGIVHRDLKSANVLLESVPLNETSSMLKAVVCDFGLAKVTHSATTLENMKFKDRGNRWAAAAVVSLILPPGDRIWTT